MGRPCCITDCGWNPSTANTTIQHISGALDLIVPSAGGSSGGAAATPIYSTGTGVTVGQGRVGTRDNGSATHLYGRLTPVETCWQGQFTVALPAIWAEIDNGSFVCRFECPSRTLTITFHHASGRCCYYSSIASGASPYDGAEMRLNLDTGAAIVKIIVPQVSGSPAPCGQAAIRHYFGNFGREGGNAVLSNYFNTFVMSGAIADNPLCGQGRDESQFPGDLSRSSGETSTFPLDIDVEAADAPERVWLGLRDSIGIAWCHGTRTYSAVEIDDAGVITSTIADYAISSSDHIEFAAFFWTAPDTVSFGVFARITTPGIPYLGVWYELIDYIALDYPADQPTPSIARGYVGAEDDYNGFKAFITCTTDHCFFDFTINQTTNPLPPFQYLDFLSDCNFHVPPRPRLPRQGGCRWAFSGYTTSSTAGPYASYDYDIGITDPDYVTLVIFYQEPFTSLLISNRAKYRLPITSYHGYRPVVLTRYELVEYGTLPCVLPTEVTVFPGSA